MVMQATDMVCPQGMPTFLVFTTMARGPLKLNLIMDVMVMEVTDMEVTVTVVVMVTAMVMVIMVKTFFSGNQTMTWVSFI